MYWKFDGKSWILEVIQEFCENNKSRKRQDLYDFLNDELGLELDAYDYDGIGDYTKFACNDCSQHMEAEYILNGYMMRNMTSMIKKIQVLINPTKFEPQI